MSYLIVNRPLVISTSQELYCFRSENIMYIQSDGNYSVFYLTDGKNYIFTMQLGKIEELIDKQLSREDGLVRLGRSLIINLNHLFNINLPKGTLTLSDGVGLTHSLKASAEALSSLKLDLEKKYAKKL